MGFAAKLSVVTGAATLLVALPACGTSSKSRSSAATSARATGSRSGAAGSRGPLRASFHAANHAPKAGQPWPYSVQVSDAGGRPLSGTVKIQFTFGGQVVGTDRPPVHPLKKGMWRDSLTYPKAAIGQPIVLQAVVHTTAGSVTLNWPVTVHK